MKVSYYSLPDQIPDEQFVLELIGDIPEGSSPQAPQDTVDDKAEGEDKTLKAPTNVTPSKEKKQ